MVLNLELQNDALAMQVRGIVELSASKCFPCKGPARQQPGGPGV